MGLQDKRRLYWFFASVALLCAATAACFALLTARIQTQPVSADAVLKWVDFGVTASAMEKALKLDIESQSQKTKLDWIELLAYLGAKYGGDFKRYKAKDMNALAEKLRSGQTIEQLTANMQYYDYYYTAYGAVLGGMVGSYQIQTQESYDDGKVEMVEKYGLKAYSPIAYGYSFSHYDDFGNSRSFGFRRTHLGNDLMGGVGTPIIAVESGVVETVGWNRYGGWRVGVRSLDGRRYYYYAHLRKDRPYHADLKEGEMINAGDILGYLGRTGYSSKENVNGMQKPHLHFGMQLIFDESQKEGNNEIWIDVYEIVKLLQRHKSPVVREDATKEYYRKYKFIDPEVEKLGGVVPKFSSQPQTDGGEGQQDDP